MSTRYELLTDDAKALLDDLPSWARDVPEFQAICQCEANESARFDALAAEVRDNFIPARATGLLLGAWERAFALTTEIDDPDEVRRSRVVAAIAAARPDPSGSKWVADVTAEIGPGWSYTENAATYTIEIVVPFDDPVDARVYERIRPLTPAHLELIIDSTGGFELDVSPMDETSFLG